MSTEGVVAVTTFVTHARRWESGADGGWELYVDGVGVTQVDHLGEAESQVRDLIETISGASAQACEVRIMVEGAAR